MNVLAGLLLGCGVCALIGYFARRQAPVAWGSDGSLGTAIVLASASDGTDDDADDADPTQQESDEDYLARERMMDYEDQYTPNFHQEDRHGADSSY